MVSEDLDFKRVCKTGMPVTDENVVAISKYPRNADFSPSTPLCFIKKKEEIYEYQIKTHVHRKPTPPQKKSLTQPLVNGNVEKLIFYTFYIFNDTIYLTIVMYISLTNQLNNKLN